MVFAPFNDNERLIDQFFKILKKSVATEKQIIKTRVTSYISYLQTGYFNKHSHLGYPNWDYAHLILNGDNDVTNNVSETLNRKWNNTLKDGYKSFAKAASVIHHQKEEFIGEFCI